MCVTEQDALAKPDEQVGSMNYAAESKTNVRQASKLSGSQKSKRSRTHSNRKSSDKKLEGDNVRETPIAVKYLKEKAKDFTGIWKPLEVFDSLPSMYTKERWEELKRS